MKGIHETKFLYMGLNICWGFPVRNHYLGRGVGVRYFNALMEHDPSLILNAKPTFLASSYLGPLYGRNVMKNVTQNWAQL